MNILGISASHCDKGACLLQDGRLLSSVQENFFIKGRQQKFFPVSSLNHCLQEGKITIEDLDLIVFCDNPFVQSQRIVMTGFAHAPLGIGPFLKDMMPWITQQLWIVKTIFRTTGFQGEILFSGRHESLAATACFTSPFSESAFLTVDSGCERATSAYGVGSFNNLSVVAEQYYPHSLELFYSALLHYIGLTGVDASEFMKLASKGKPKYQKMILSNLLDLKADGSFKLNMNYFDCGADMFVISKKFNELLNNSDKRLESLSQQHKDLARSVLEVIEEVVLRTVRHLHRETGQKKICVVGAGTMNCVNKNKIVSETGFDELYVQPTSSGAIGAVLFAWHEYYCKSQSVTLQNYVCKGMHLKAACL